MGRPAEEEVLEVSPNPAALWGRLSISHAARGSPSASIGASARLSRPEWNSGPLGRKRMMKHVHGPTVNSRWSVACPDVSLVDPGTRAANPAASAVGNARRSAHEARRDGPMARRSTGRSAPTLVVAALLLMASLPPPASAAPITLTAQADASVLAGSPTTNRGTLASLRVRNSSTMSYLRFDVPDWLPARPCRWHRCRSMRAPAASAPPASRSSVQRTTHGWKPPSHGGTGRALPGRSSRRGPGARRGTRAST